MITITSKTNALIKATKKLQQKKYRHHSYLIEGWHLFEEAQKAQATFRHIFVTQEGLEYVNGVPTDIIICVSKEVLASLSDSKTPQGIVAEVVLEEQPIPEYLAGKYLFLERVQDPGNVGTLIRTADAAGFSGVFISSDSADIYNQKTLRSMQGSHFHLPIYQGESSYLLTYFSTQEPAVLATTLSKDSIAYYDLPDMTNVVLALGNEGQGITEALAEQSDYKVHIPMPGQAESLNVAIAGAILMFHLI